MTENSVNRQKYAAIMEQVEVLEETVADLEKDIKAARELPDAQEVRLLEQELQDKQTQLADRRAELTRLSDGCGRPHPQ